MKKKIIIIVLFVVVKKNQPTNPTLKICPLVKPDVQILEVVPYFNSCRLKFM